jgi:uncharacterized protein YjeT (DUF2065 family)
VSRTRLLGAALVAAGLAHVLAPEGMLELGSPTYEFLRVADVELLADATERIRAVGVALLAVGGHLAYHDGVLPARD